MIPSGLFTQIIMLGLAIGIVFAYVQPAFSTIGEIQDDISVYRAERDKVSGVNQQLQQLLDNMLAIPAQDRVALLTYIPDTVDTVAVPRDLQSMAESSGLILRTVAPVQTTNMQLDAERSATVPTTRYAFQITVEGSYQQIKAFLLLVEKNNYPLDIQTLTMQPLEGSFMTATMQLVTHAHLPRPEVAAPVNRRR